MRTESKDATSRPHSHPVTAGNFPLWGCLRSTKFCWVGKVVNILWMKTDELPKPKANPTQEKNRLKVAFGPLCPTANIFSWAGIGFMWETNRLREPQPKEILREHAVYFTVADAKPLGFSVEHSAGPTRLTGARFFS